MRSAPRAMILAAGQGKRLRPLTASLAKPALPLLGRPLIEYTFRRLVRAGVREVVVNLHHHAESLEPVLDRARAQLEVHESREAELLGTAGGVKKVGERLSGKTFLLLNGDTVFDFDLSELVQRHRSSRAKATLVLRSKRGGTRFSSVTIDDDGRVVRIDKRDRGPGLMFAGVWLLEPSVLELLSGRPGGLDVELLPALIEEKTVFACVQERSFITVDTPGRYWAASLTMAREGLFEEDWGVRRHCARLFRGEDTTLGDGMYLEGSVVLGARCRVGAGACLKNVVCWDDVQIPAGAVLSNAVISDGVRIPEGEDFSGKLLMRVPPDRTEIRKREVRGGLVIASLEIGRSLGLRS
ncbi:MAG TPA: NDP-sugar synthase [Vicinamibacteria bacterium]|nr:NDP-sugar synthase [Vicinamibacteria bacterium]